MPFELSRVKLYGNDLRGNKNYFELAEGSSNRGKVTVNVWRTSRGNRFWFELARGSSWRGFELSGVNCITRHASCCVPLCTINFKNSPGLAFYRIPKTRRFFSVVLAPRQRSYLWSCFTVHSSSFSRGKIAPGTSSFSFFFSFNSTFRFAILSSFNPAETFQFALRHVCSHSRPPK